MAEATDEVKSDSDSVGDKEEQGMVT